MDYKHLECVLKTGMAKQKQSENVCMHFRGPHNVSLIHTPSEVAPTHMSTCESLLGVRR